MSYPIKEINGVEYVYLDYHDNMMESLRNSATSQTITVLEGLLEKSEIGKVYRNGDSEGKLVVPTEAIQSEIDRLRKGK